MITQQIKVKTLVDMQTKTYCYSAFQVLTLSLKIWQLLTIDFAEKVHAWQDVYLSLERRTLGQLVAEAFDRTK